MSSSTNRNPRLPGFPEPSHQNSLQRQSRTGTTSYPYITAGNGRHAQQLGPLNPLGVRVPSPFLFADPVPPLNQLPQLHNQYLTNSTARESLDVCEKSSPVPGNFPRKSQRLGRKKRRICPEDVDDSAMLQTSSRFCGDEVSASEKHAQNKSLANEYTAHSTASSQLTMNASKHGMIPGLANYLNNKIEHSSITGNLATRASGHSEASISASGELSLHDAHNKYEKKEQYFDPDEESLIRAIQDLKLFQDLRITPLKDKQTTQIDRAARAPKSTINMDGAPKKLLVHTSDLEDSFEEIDLNSSGESEPSDSDFEMVETTASQTDVNGRTSVVGRLLETRQQLRDQLSN